MKINIGKLFGAALKVAKSNPALVLGAVSIGREIVKAVKDEGEEDADSARLILNRLRRAPYVYGLYQCIR